MPNTSYVLKQTNTGFNRPNNTTAYSAFTMVSNGSSLLIPAPVSDRPFYIRRIQATVSPGIASVISATLYLYSSDPSAIMTFVDGAFINTTPAITAGILETRLTLNYPSNSQGNILDLTLPANLMLFCPSGSFASSLDTNTAFTPVANQRFNFEYYFEYSN